MKEDRQNLWIVVCVKCNITSSNLTAMVEKINFDFFKPIIPYSIKCPSFVARELE